MIGSRSPGVGGDGLDTDERREWSPRGDQARTSLTKSRRPKSPDPGTASRRRCKRASTSGGWSPQSAKDRRQSRGRQGIPRFAGCSVPVRCLSEQHGLTDSQTSSRFLPCCRCWCFGAGIASAEARPRDVTSGAWWPATLASRTGNHDARSGRGQDEDCLIGACPEHGGMVNRDTASR